MSKVNHYVQYSIKYERNQALRNEAIKIHHLKPMFSIKRNKSKSTKRFSPTMF